MNSQYVPSFGYQEGNELGDDDIRQRNGLKPKPRMKQHRRSGRATQQLSHVRRRLDHVRRNDLHGARPDLDRAGVSGARVDRERPPLLPLRDGQADPRLLRDALGALRRERARRTTASSLEIYYNPRHAFALPSMLQASKDGLDYFGKNFSPYLYRQYRVIEFPRYRASRRRSPTPFRTRRASASSIARKRATTRSTWPTSSPRTSWRTSGGHTRSSAATARARRCSPRVSPSIRR